MKEATINVEKTSGSCPRLTTTNQAGVTITDNGTKITVPPEKAQLKFVYEAGSLDGFKIAKTESDVSSAPVLGVVIGQVDEEGTAFAVERIATTTTTLTDKSQRGTWHFQMCLDGTWVDPQIYNKGTG